MTPGAKSRIYGVLVTVWVALSVGSIALALMVWLRLGQSLDNSLATARVEIGLVDVVNTLRAEKNSERAYLLEGDPAELAAAQRTEGEIPGKLSWLRSATAASPERHQQVLAFEALVETQLADLHRLLALRRAGTDVAPALRQEQADLARLQETVDRTVPLPRNFLAFEATAARRQLRRSLMITLAAGVLSLGTGVFAFYLARVANEKEQSERLLAQQALRAERVAQEKSLFMANMSHEIRTPMNAILGFSEMLAAGLPADSRQRRQAIAIQQSAASLLQLINDILDLSKVEAGRLEIHREPADLREVSDFMRMVFAQQAARKGLRLDIQVAPELPPALLVDRARLRQILVNLLANALKFTSEGGVTLRTLWQPSAEEPNIGRLAFEVEDTGRGIPPAQHEAVFQPFVQVETSGGAEAQGSGLGLSIVRRLSERMDGSVSLESEVGRGSVFQVVFPTVVRSGGTVAATAADPLPVDFDRLQATAILAVDDNALNRELLAGMFEGTHHAVRFACNGREAVDSAREAPPGLILMDLRMPEMDGPTALKLIRQLPRGAAVPVIAVTASSGPGHAPPDQTGFNGYVRKPFTRQALFTALARFLPQKAADFPLGGRPAPVPAPATAAIGPDLRRDLDQLAQQRWAQVRETGSIAEVKDFAQQLSALAQAHECPRLQAYADDLRHAADDYAIIRIEKSLAQFPTLIATLGAAPAPLAAAHA